MKKRLNQLVLLCALFGVFWVVTHWNGLQLRLSSLWQQVYADSGSSFRGAGIQGEAAVLMDRDTGEMLFHKNDHKKMYPASTTKILTALIALERGNPDDKITVGDEVRMRTSDESSAGLIEGQTLRLRDLLAAMMLPSGNDAARTIALYVARQESGRELTAEDGIRYFADLMNERAQQVGANDSHFVNPHGLHERDHYTTAYDMALIAREAMSNNAFRQIVKQPKHRTVTVQSAWTYWNRNKLLQQGNEYYYEGANGIKTGFTSEAGYCLVASANKGDKNLISIVLHSTESGVWLDSRMLFDLGFDQMSMTASQETAEKKGA